MIKDFNYNVGPQMDELESTQLRQALHDINNSLNIISIQSELAILYCHSGDIELAQAALEAIAVECRNCSGVSHSMQSDFFHTDE